MARTIAQHQLVRLIAPCAAARRGGARAVAIATALGAWLCGGPAAAPAATTTYSTSWSGGTIAAGDSAIVVDGGGIGGDVVADGTLQFNTTTDLTVTGTISGTGALAVTNSGTVRLAGLVSGRVGFDLAVTAASGRLMVGASGTSPFAVGSAGAGTLAVSGGSVSSGTAFLGLGPGSFGSATVTSGSWTTNSKPLYVGFSGSGALVVNGGLVSDSSGVVGHPGSVGVATVTSGTWKNGGPLYVGGFSSGSGVGSGTLAVTGGQVTNTFGYLGFGAGNVGVATVSGGTWTSSQNLTVGGAGTGTLTISGTGGTGGTVIVGGTLARGSAGTINLAAGGTLQIGSGSTTGVLATDLVNQGAVVFKRTGTSTIATAIGGSGGVTLTGGGTFLWSGTSTFSGPTAVNAATLVVNGTLGDTAVAVNAGAVLAGGGSIAGPVTIAAGGTLAPGPGTQRLALGSLALGDGAVLVLRVNSGSGGAASLVSLAGGISLSGGVGLSLADLAASPAAFADGTTLSLVEYAGVWNGGLFAWAGAPLGDGAAFMFADRLWQMTYGATSAGANVPGGSAFGGRYVNIVAVPEPAAWTLVAGACACGRLLPRRSRPAPGRGRRARGVTIVELLATVAVVGGLAALLLPAVQSAREGSRRVHCLNNLRQIGVGFHAFHAARDCFPSAVSGGGARHYWAAQILPFLEDRPLAGLYDYTVACTDPRNRDAVQVPLSFTRCPSAPGGARWDVKFIKTGTSTWPAAVADYAGSSGPSNTLWNAPAVVAAPKPAVLDGFFTGTVVPGVRGRRVRDITDGISKSIAVFECGSRPQVWAFGAQVPGSGLSTSAAAAYVGLCGWADANQFSVRGFLLDPAQADPASRCTSPGPQLVNGSNNLGIYAAHPAGAHALFADAATGFLAESTAADVVAALLTIKAGDSADRP